MVAIGTSRRYRAVREDGDIITSGLFSILAILAVIGLLVYEVVAVGVAAVTADDDARYVARAAASTFREQQSWPPAQAAAEQEASDRGTSLVTIGRDGDDLEVTLEKRARTLLVHRLGPLEDLATTSATGRARWTTS